MTEDPFVDFAFNLASRVLHPPLRVERGASLLYQITVDNRLKVAVDPRQPSRGQSAFQTDLCVFDDVSSDVSLPRVVVEFKKSMTTHDVLTYSSKARKHKQVYPYLRYGLVASNDSVVPGRFFTHNEALDFCLALGDTEVEPLARVFGRLLEEEIAASRRLEHVVFGSTRARLFRTEVALVEDAETEEHADNGPEATALI